MNIKKIIRKAKAKSRSQHYISFKKWFFFFLSYHLTVFVGINKSYFISYTA